MLVTNDEYFSTVYLVDLRATTNSAYVYEMCTELLKDHEEYYNNKYRSLKVEIFSNNNRLRKQGTITSCSLLSYFVFCIDVNEEFEMVKSPKGIEKIDE